MLTKTDFISKFTELEKEIPLNMQQDYINELFEYLNEEDYIHPYLERIEKEVDNELENIRTSLDNIGASVS